jgi:hypothetical protein
MGVPALIELDRLPPEQASLLTLFLLTMIREYLKTAPQREQNPRYVIVLEEAHRIAGAQHKVQPSSDVADPKGHATEIICQGLVELRGLDVGIIIIDQFPSAVAPEVIKSTTTKLAFRQVAQQDRDELGATMLFGKTEMEEIARLGVGEAFFITEGYYKPCKIQTVNLHDQIDFRAPIANEKILPYINENKWYRQAYVARKYNELSRLKADMDILDAKRIEINRQLIHLLAQDPRLKNDSKHMSIDQLVAKIKTLRNILQSSFEDFSINSYRKYFPHPDALCTHFSELLSMKKDLEERYKTVIQPDVDKATEMMDAYIKRFMSH